MSDLTEFVEARLAEDERDNCESTFPPPGPFPCNCAYPARVLRDVEAKRRILAQWQDGNTYGPDRNLSMLLVVQELASVWSDHPDYDPAWGGDA